MADVFNLTAAFDKSAYNAGDTMTVAVTGTVVSGSPTPVAATINIVAADGSTTQLAATSQVNGTEETWKIDSVIDLGGRAWTIAADGHSASAIA